MSGISRLVTAVFWFILTYRISQKIVVKGILKPIKYAAQDKKKMKYGLQIIIGDCIE
jgi:hypothetical protein